MRQVSVLFARFPYGGSESSAGADWLIPTVLKAKGDPRISAVQHMAVNDTPITMSRNRVLKECLARKIDYCLMIDSDMKPDLPYPGALPFWDTSLEFVLRHHRPCAIAAPYCGPPPHENCYVFQWAKFQSDNPNVDLKLEQFSREDASQRGGIEEVAALPTGLFLLDIRALASLEPPWFEYEYEDAPYNTRKATTEDVFFTRNLSLAGVPMYCNWDAWAGHLKTKCVGKPCLLTADQVRKEFRDALVRGKDQGEKMVMVDEGAAQMSKLTPTKWYPDGPVPLHGYSGCATSSAKCPEGSMGHQPSSNGGYHPPKAPHPERREE